MIGYERHKAKQFAKFDAMQRKPVVPRHVQLHLEDIYESILFGWRLHTARISMLGFPINEELERHHETNN